MYDRAPKRPFDAEQCETVRQASFAIPRPGIALLGGSRRGVSDIHNQLGWPLYLNWRPHEFIRWRACLFTRALTNRPRACIESSGCAMAVSSQVSYHAIICRIDVSVEKVARVFDGSLHARLLFRQGKEKVVLRCAVWITLTSTATPVKDHSGARFACNKKRDWKMNGRRRDHDSV